MLGKDGKIHKCEGQAYVGHECSGGLHVNEVLFPRNVFQKCDKSTKDYFLLNPINLSVNCAYFHERWGHSRFFRAQFLDEQVKRYGAYKVKDFINNSPIKIKRVK